MNANELADWIEKSAYGEYDSAKQTATMLRQQQEKLTKYELRQVEQRKRIDELEADLNIAKEVYEKLTKENAYFMNKNEFLLSVIKDKDAEISILRKAQEK